MAISKTKLFSCARAISLTAMFLTGVFVGRAGATELPAGAAGAMGRTVDSIVQSALTEGPLAGIAVAVVHRQDTVALAGYGLVDLNSREPLQPTTPFRIASLTKQFTAVAILQLAERGKLSLEDRLTTYFPDFPWSEHEVTIRQLLNHTSGLVRSGSSDIIYRRGFHYTPEAVINFLGTKPFRFAPGTNWEYSNIGYDLLGLIIEKVSGMGFGQYIKQHIFDSLGMFASYLIEDNSSVPQGYINTKSGLAPFQLRGNAAWAAGGAVSTAVDLLKWQLALKSHRVISEKSVEMMYSSTSLSDGAEIPYGFASRNGAIAGHKIVGHTGWWAGFSSVLVYFPDDDLTIVVLSNTGTMSPHAVNIAARIARAVLRVHDNKTKQIGARSSAATDLTGTYRSGLTAIEVRRQGKQWFLQESKRQRPTRLQHVSGLTYTYGRWSVEFRSTRQNTWLLRFNDGIFWDLAAKTKHP